MRGVALAVAVAASSIAACGGTSRLSGRVEPGPGKGTELADAAAPEAGGSGRSGWNAASVVGHAFPYNLSVASNGSALIVGSVTEGTPLRVWAAHFTPAEGWSAPETLFTTPPPTNGREPFLFTRTSIDDSGEAITGWYVWD